MTAISLFPDQTTSSSEASALLDACSTGDLPRLRFLMDKERTGHRVYDATLLNLLAEATVKRHSSVVKLLLDHTSSTATFSHDLIYSAMEAGLDTYKLYLAARPAILSYQWEGLGDVVCCTSTKNDGEFLSYILRNGADPGRSLYNSPRFFYKYLPLEYCALSSHTSSTSNARLLLEHGAIIEGTEAVQLAASAGQLAMVQLLLEARGNINALLDRESPCYKYPHVYGTPLHNAISGGHLDIVRFLLESGADINMRDTAGKTAAMRASATERLLQIELLHLLYTYRQK
ncbi:hypothetical protein MMC17_003455 [Xylographa soralifera]|nr:hypothetical protein [Xylographa soralifera]